MALVIYNNTYSLAAQGALNKISNAQGKVIQQLSTGLRINSASDDASGLAISEKLRGQISGLKRATMNAQDGVSYLQVVDGSMGEVSNMLLRVRELAVQAGSGIYTTNERAVLQLEVDQLKDEINRVSRASEFNTKKLLNGDATAVWSSDRAFLKGIVRGPEVSEGNYRIDADVTPGSNSVYKSNIMGINKGTLAAEIFLQEVGMNLEAVREPVNLPLTTDDNTFEIGIATNITSAAQTVTNMTDFKQAGSTWAQAGLVLIPPAGGVGGINELNLSGYYQLELLGSGEVATDNSSEVPFRYRIMDAKTGQFSNWITATSTAAATGSAVFTMNTRSALGPLASNSEIRFSLPANAIITSGDKMVGKFEKPLPAAVPTNPLTDWASQGGGTIILGRPLPPPTGTFYARVDYSAANSLTKPDNGDNKVDYTKVPYYMLTMDPTTGFAQSASLTLEMKETISAGATVVGTASVRVRDEGVATKDTKLSDIAAFTTPDGTKVLALGQELKIYANGRSASIYLEPNDRVEDFVNKLTAAIINDLGLGADPNTEAGRLVNQNLVKYVPNTDAVPNSNQALPGTFVIQTAAIGKLADLSFIGDEKLIKALNLVSIKESSSSNMNITVTDAHTGKLIGKDEVSDGVLRNVIKGMDIVLDQTLGLSYSWNSTARTIDFIKNVNNQTAYFHVVDTRTELQIGANQGQTMNISVGQLDTTGLEIDDLYVVNMQQSQEAIGKVDKALNLVVGLRATTGAYMNRLQYTISNLGTIRENLIAAESRIRDLDIASASTELAKNQILMQAATAMVAQANAIPQNALTLIRGS